MVHFGENGVNMNFKYRLFITLLTLDKQTIVRVDRNGLIDFDLLFQ